MNEFGNIVAFIASIIAIVTVLKNRYWLLLLLAFIYTIFAATLIIVQFTEQNIILKQTWLHVMGILFLLVSILIPLINKNQRISFFGKIKVLVSKDTFKAHEKETKEVMSCSIDEIEAKLLKFSEDEIEKKLLKFSEDANEIIILGGSGKFLMDKNNNKPSEQYNLIKSEANKYKILLNTKNNDSPPIGYLHDLNKKGAIVKGYSDNNILRGRLKDNTRGKSVLLYDKIENNSYELNKIENQYIVNLIYHEITDIVYRRSTNIFIKYICFDLAGVFCTGDINKFFKNVEDIIGLSIPVKADHHLCIDKKLNLDENYNIINYLFSEFPQKAKKTIINNGKDKIIEYWKTTWKLNEHIQKLASKLKTLGYTIAICSNCDALNANHYRLSQYFLDFDTIFSYECKCVKPQEEFFNYILQKYNCKPYEVLFIDDHQKNTNIAKSLGFETIFVDRNLEDEEKADFINQRLIEKGIGNSDS